jgi:chemotaxis protein methyltransferase CheR
MNEVSIAHLAELVRRRSGIALAESKAALILRRLAPVARTFGFKDASTLLTGLAHPPEELACAVTEAMTTQDTWFFRDPEVFDLLEKSLLPGLVVNRRHKQRLRIWSAGCATGQEAYSLAMILEELALAASGWAIELLATDISGEAVARAKSGFFADHEVARGLPAARRLRHFVRDGAGWRVHERLRRGVTFRTFNLLDDYGWLGEIDLILCRNVLMYFDQHTRSAALRKVSHALAADGVLVLGTREVGPGPTFLPTARMRSVLTKAQRNVRHVMRAAGRAT